ncbi:MAG: YihY/virulence factor BrkB family protein [Planctomycetes bacterium]|nr:YihY/virulence factor BrkB family protein [Planctomycetota bacterium]
MLIVTPILESIHRLLTQPVSELGRARRAVRYAAELVQHCTAELRHDRATEAAAALTYRTIFSMVPLIVLALLIFNTFGDSKGVGSEVQGKIYDYLGLSTLAYSSSSGSHVTGDSTRDPSQQKVDREMKARVDQVFKTLTDQVSQVRLGSIGLVGIVLFIWAALSLIVTMEQTFNRVYNCPVGRPWVMRIALYWAGITLGPLLLFLSLYMSGRMLLAAHSLGVGAWLLGQVSHSAALSLSWLMLFLLYILMPNTRVDRRAALIGSFVTAVLFEISKWGFGLYVSKAVPYSKIYGSLGLVPLFLLWVYVIWLLVLFGLELTYTLQAMKGRRFKHLDTAPHNGTSGDPRWIIPLLARVAQGFETGRPVTHADLSIDLGLPGRAIEELTGLLEKQSLIHRVVGDKGSDGLTLSLPPEKIPLSRLLDLSRSLSLAPGLEPGAESQAMIDSRLKQPGWAALDQLEQAQRRGLESKTLASVMKRD